MPVLERLDWVEEQVHAGRSFRLSIGPALKDNTYKYKVLIGKCGNTSLSHKQMAISNINLLRDVFERSSVVDRGHQHSSGDSEVAFYVTPLRLGQSADLPPVPPPVEEPITQQSPLLFTVPPAAQLPMFDTKVLDKIASLGALLYDHLQYVSMGIGHGTLQQLCDQQNLIIQTLQSRINFQVAWEQRLQETNQMLDQSYLNGAMNITSKLDSMAETICGMNIISKIDSMAATVEMSRDYTLRLDAKVTELIGDQDALTGANTALHNKIDVLADVLATSIRKYDELFQAISNLDTGLATFGQRITSEFSQFQDSFTHVSSGEEVAECFHVAVQTSVRNGADIEQGKTKEMQKLVAISNLASADARHQQYQQLCEKWEDKLQPAVAILNFLDRGRDLAR